MTYLFPILMMIMSTGAAGVYGLHGDLKRAVYWLAATVITAAVTL